MEEELKEELFGQVKNLEFVNFWNLKSNILLSGSKISPSFLPWHYIKVYNAKFKFVERYCEPQSGEPFFANNFKIDADEMNRIIEDNFGSKFLHFFFCNIKLPIGDDLGLILRFSDTETFIDDQSLDSTIDKSYFIGTGGQAILLNSQKFTTIIQEYEKGVGSIIDQKTKLTKYITYDMINIELFKGFEHELVFETVCTEDKNSELRLGLVVYVKDKDRIHHTNTTAHKDYYEGYYDAGDLKP